MLGSLSENNLQIAEGAEFPPTPFVQYNLFARVERGCAFSLLAKSGTNH